MLTGGISMILNKGCISYLSSVLWLFPTHLIRTIFYTFLRCWFWAEGKCCLWKPTLLPAHMLSLHHSMQFSDFAEFSTTLSIAGLLFTALGTFWKMFTFSLLMLKYYEMHLCNLLHIYTIGGKCALHKHIQTVQIVLKNEWNTKYTCSL